MGVKAKIASRSTVDAGFSRALRTGRDLHHLGFPIHRVFVAPFIRCVQTASQAISGLFADDDDGSLSVDPSKVKVSIEYGLCEMLSTVAIRAESAPKDEDFHFNVSELEAMLPSAVDLAAQRIYPEVGNAFARQYYEIMEQSPKLVCRFYQDMSKLGRSEESGAMGSTTTMEFLDNIDLERERGITIKLQTTYSRSKVNLDSYKLRVFNFLSKEHFQSINSCIFYSTSPSGPSTSGTIISLGANVGPPIVTSLHPVHLSPSRWEQPGVGKAVPIDFLIPYLSGNSGVVKSSIDIHDSIPLSNSMTVTWSYYWRMDISLDIAYYGYFFGTLV